MDVEFDRGFTGQAAACLIPDPVVRPSARADGLLARLEASADGEFRPGIATGRRLEER